MNGSRFFASRWVLRAALGGVFVFLVLFLICAKKPWQISSINKIHDYAAFYSWWAAAINLLPLAVLLLTVGSWSKPLALSPPPPPPALPKGFWPAVLAAMMVCAVFGGLRLNSSLWDDEEYSVRRAILGTYRTKSDGAAGLKELPWTHTLWFYTKPTNHIFQSILSRLSLSAWRAVARPGGIPLNEAAVRFPAYLAGILSVGAIALLLAKIGFAWEGALAAWLLALHPWHMRMAPEARGYALVFLLIPVVCLLAVRVLESGRWRWWLGFALAEFLLLYTWPPAIGTLLLLNACLVIQILAGARLREARAILLKRWLVSGVAAGALLFQLMLPCIPQFAAYMKNNQNFSMVNFWLKNVGSLFLTGSLWSKSGKLISPYPETCPVAATHPILFALAALAAVTALAWGACRLWKTTRWLVLVFLLPGSLMVAAAVIQNTYIFEWYVAFMLPGLVAIASIGVLGMATSLVRAPAPRWLPLGAALAALGVFALISHTGRAFLLTRPAQPFRESVLATRPLLDLKDPKNQSVITVSSVASPEVYDPFVRQAKTLDAYILLMKEADEKGIPLYANNGFPLALKLKFPPIAALLADDSVFELTHHFYAIEDMLDRTVHRYRPGAVKTANFSKYRRAAAADVPASVPMDY